MEQYLDSSEYIDWEQPLAAARAVELADGANSDEAVVRRCFEFVRDSIQHSWDYWKNPVTCKISEVLFHGTGYWIDIFSDFAILIVLRIATWRVFLVVTEVGLKAH